METKTRYFVIPGPYTMTSSLLIKFDGQFWYWGESSKQWIHEQSLYDRKLIQITEREAEKIIKKGAPIQLDYRRGNPQFDNTIS
jgi:uncharacterized HAD superfamily protein